MASPSMRSQDQSLISIISSISSEHKRPNHNLNESKISHISHNTTFDKGFIEENKENNQNDQFSGILGNRRNSSTVEFDARFLSKFGTATT